MDNRSSNVIPIRPPKTSERLDARSRASWCPNRDLLRHLAERFRAIEAIEDEERQLELREAA
jgi:hypothetical protein